MVFVWSQSKARQEAATRERHAAKVRAEFEAVERNLGRYSLTTTEAIVRRLEAGGTSLEESLALWERGEELEKVCRRWLEGARERLDAALAEEAAAQGEGGESAE